MVVFIKSVEIKVEEGVHPLDEKYGDEIGRNWEKQLAAKSSLYNGEFFLSVNVKISNGILTGTSRRTNFATFLYWLHHPTDIEGVFHVFSIAAMIGADNKVIMGRMSAHTANGGRIYMPAGSISDEDVCGGVIDFDTCMKREVFEETGIKLNLAESTSGFMLFEKKGVLALIREFHLTKSSGELINEIEKNLPDLQEQELDSVYAYGPGETENTMPQFLQEYQMYRLTQGNIT